MVITVYLTNKLGTFQFDSKFFTGNWEKFHLTHNGIPFTYICMCIFKMSLAKNVDPHTLEQNVVTFHRLLQN